MADKVRKVAVEIANELFTNGSGEHARHLNLIMDGGRYVGGWCEAAVADIIERKIRAAQQNAHLTPESLATSQAVSNASGVSQSDSDTAPAQAQVA